MRGRFASQTLLFHCDLLKSSLKLIQLTVQIKVCLQTAESTAAYKKKVIQALSLELYVSKDYNFKIEENLVLWSLPQ